jgi:hypothetical protein
MEALLMHGAVFRVLVELAAIEISLGYPVDLFAFFDGSAASDAANL